VLTFFCRSNSRKHEARAQRLLGEILAATGRLKESAPLLEASVMLAHGLKVPRDEWMGALALGKLLTRLGKDKEAEVAFTTAAATVEAGAAIATPRLIQNLGRGSFRTSAPIWRAISAVPSVESLSATRTCSTIPAEISARIKPIDCASL
jgi:hypothetical protein